MDPYHFKMYCKHFLSVSDDIQDGWQIMIQSKPDFTDDFYLKKRIARSYDIGKNVINPEENGNLNEMEDLDYYDPSSKNTVNLSETTTWEYHIVFNESYGVPALYFNCWKNDGSLLTFEEILSGCHSEIKPQLLENRWQSITQQEHPILGKPFYVLHPCKTADYLSTIQGDSRVNPLVSWLSSFGGAVGLNLPLEYGMNHYFEKDFAK